MPSSEVTDNIQPDCTFENSRASVRSERERDTTDLQSHSGALLNFGRQRWQCHVAMAWSAEGCSITYVCNCDPLIFLTCDSRCFWGDVPVGLEVTGDDATTAGLTLAAIKPPYEDITRRATGVRPLNLDTAVPHRERIEKPTMTP
jgi:hypothetical protein